ncbi:MAG: exlusion protein FxsA [Methylomonas sp.]|nr:MAG: exlusion protein FxsA [Methylomonas sp.]PPD25264.1 MAG: exlusion protein FxsA [Methylomonas sp.]PPD35206.1 MAG: exlusion protein FxsA [Methylomonas sp.]PPD53387.1 MAG: exlusion protein FxsA [Methylomonas sp.]
MKIVFLGFLIVPFVEIYLLIQMGAVIGAFPTIMLVVATAVLGAWLLKKQGLATWQRFQSSLAQGTIPAYEMIEGPILLVGGALLLTPGFFTDCLGFACLIPSLRRRMARYVIERHLIDSSGLFHNQGFAQRPPDVIEGEYRSQNDDR